MGRAATGRAVEVWAVSIMHSSRTRWRGNGLVQTISACSLTWGYSTTRGQPRQNICSNRAGLARRFSSPQTSATPYQALGSDCPLTERREPGISPLSRVVGERR